MNIVYPFTHTLETSVFKLYTFKLLGFFMLCWYGAVRWTIYADPALFPWAYKPINMLTAFLSIVFIMPTLLMTFSTRYSWLYLLGAFLAFRNMYYTIEDIIDFQLHPVQQTVYIALDLLMLVYCVLYLEFRKEYQGEVKRAC